MTDGQPACVLVWNTPDVNQWGDEFLVYYVAYGDEDGELINGNIETCSSYEAAVEAGFARAAKHDWTTIEDDCCLE